MRNAKKELLEYWNARRDLEAAVRYIRELEAQATATGSMAPKEVQVISSLPLAARFEDILADKVDLENIVEAERVYLEQAKTNVESIIAELDDKRQRRVLTLRYIGCLSWKKVAKISGYSEDWIYSIHRKAINKLNSSQQLHM